MISASGITKTYSEGVRTSALCGVDLNVARGGFISIMGPSGSGKSSLLNILGCLDNPTSGRYLLSGLDVSGLSHTQAARLRNNCIGFVFQSFFLLPQLTAAQNIELPLIYRGDSPSCRRELVNAMLLRLGLYSRRDHLSEQLSGGQRQRVAIGRALICDPRLILADEPTGNLDSKSGGEIMDIFSRLHENGATIVLITHDLSVAKRAEKTFFLRNGRLYEE